MNKRDILVFINETIESEKGSKVVITGMFTDANLDSLGTFITLVTISSEFNIFSDIEIDIASLDIPNLTIRELVNKCILSSTSTSAGQSNEMGT